MGVGTKAIIDARVDITLRSILVWFEHKEEHMVQDRSKFRCAQNNAAT